MEKNEVKRVPDEAAIIGLNLRSLRKRAGLSQKQVAAILGVTFQQVQKYEQGQNRLPVEKLHLFKNYLGVSYECFFQGLERKGHGPRPEFLYAALEHVRDPALLGKIERVVMIMLE